MLRRLTSKLFGIEKAILGLILVGTMTQSLVMVKSGIEYNYGIGFWGPNSHDGLWHISLISQLSKFDFSHPTFSGYSITNYHYGFDLVTAAIHKLTGVPIITLYFQILPPLFSFTIGILSYSLISSLSSSLTAKFWTIFFVFFGGSFGYIVNLLKGQELGGESAFWAIQPVSFPINPPLTLSFIFLLTGLILLRKYISSRSKVLFIICSFLFGSMVMIKAYAGLISLTALLSTAIYRQVREKKSDLLLMFASSMLIALFVFLPSNSHAGQLIKFSPLWFPRTMMEFADRVGWQKFSQARTTYMQSKNLPKWFLAELIGIGVFVVGNLGIRIIGIPAMLNISVLKKNPHTAYLYLFLLTGVIVSILPTLIFVQSGNPWNIIQFFYYSELFMSFFVALYLDSMRNHRLYKFFGLAIVAITLPSTFGTLTQFLPSRPPSAIPSYEVKALKFLATQPPGIVLAYPFDKSRFNHFTEPRPVFAYESTAYVSAISNHPSFLEDEVNLEISNYPWQDRKMRVQEFFSTKDNNIARRFTQDNQIRYIYYLVDNQSYSFGPSQIGFKEIYYVPHEVRILAKTTNY